MRPQFSRAPRGAWLVLLCSLFSLLWTACDPHIGVIVYEDGVRSPRDPVALQAKARTLIGWEASSRIGFFDLDALRARRSLAVSSTDAGIDFDVFVDEEGMLQHLVLFQREGEDVESGGTLSLYPDAGEIFGRPIDLGFYGGFSNVMGVREGALVWSHDDAGQRWHLARRDKQPTTSYGCPLPTSIFEARALEDHSTVTALARSAEDTAVVLLARYDSTGVKSCTETEIEAPLPLSRNLRGAHVPGSGSVIADLEDGRVVLSRLAEGEGTQKLVTSLEAQSLEAVVPFQIGDRAGLVLLSAKPALVAAIELETEGEELRVVRTRSVRLGASVSRMRTFFSREIAVAGDRVFVTTSAGLEVYALDGESEANLSPVSVPEEMRGLRGRLAVAP